VKKSIFPKNNHKPEKGKTPTIFDVAQRAGVSIATVSRALSTDSHMSRSVKQREKVLAVVESLGYTPNVAAQGLRQRQTNLIAVSGWFKGRSFTSIETLLGIHERLAETKYAVYLRENHENYRVDEKTFREFGRRNFVCGIILLNHRVRKSTVDSLKKTETPLLLTEYSLPGVDNLTIDNFKGGYLAMKHLLDQGCRNIAVIVGWLKHPHLRDRVLGCRKALKEAGLPSGGQFLINPHFPLYGEGRRVAKKIMELKPRVDGVFSSAGDVVAMGAINYFKENSLRVPEDIRVVGFDDIQESAYFEPALTTVHQPMFQLGFKAADHLIRVLEGKHMGSEKIVLEPHLVIRKSG